MAKKKAGKKKPKPSSRSKGSKKVKPKKAKEMAVKPELVPLPSAQEEQPKLPLKEEKYFFNEDFIKGLVVGLILAFVLVAGYATLFF